MQNYGQAPGYQRPGSTASFQAQPPAPPPPPGYGVPQGYQSTNPGAQSQWTAPAPAPTPPSGPWNQSQPQSAGGYNPGTYGVMGQQQPPPPQQSYPDQPPPPPPKPYGFAAAVQRQRDSAYVHQVQQGGYPVQGTQPSYNDAAPPPASVTPGGSYFPPAQDGRPSSVYGAGQLGSYTNNPHVPPTVMSPNEQQPTYIPPSLTGQGVQAYMPSNTNPAPGVYVPPPPDVPAWQQAQHAPLQGGAKKYRYTKPTVDPSFYAQGHQGIQPMHPPPLPQRQYGQPNVPPQQPFNPPTHHQYENQGQMMPQIPLPNQYTAHQSQQNPVVYSSQPHQQSYGQPIQAQGQYQQQLVQEPTYQQSPPSQQYSQPQNQWQSPMGVNQGTSEQQYQASYASSQPNQQQQQQQQQQQWQQGQQLQQLPPTQQFGDEDMQAPKPLSRTETTSSEFFTQLSPQSQPVSPIIHGQNAGSTSGHRSSSGHTGSVSSIALANLHAQRTEHRASTPKSTLTKLPTPPPRDDKSKFSALGSGGPSDWERLDAEEEIDDEELFAAKKEDKKHGASQLQSVELPAHVPAPSSTHSWPSPATQPAPLNIDGRRSIFAPTPPLPTISPAQQQIQQSPLQATVTETENAGSQGVSQSVVSVLPPSSAQQGFVTDEGAWAGQSMHASVEELAPITQQQQLPLLATDVVMREADRSASQLISSQSVSAMNENHVAQLKAKDEAFEQLRSQSSTAEACLQGEIDRLQAEVAKLTADLDDATERATREQSAWADQAKTMEANLEQAQTSIDTLSKENVSTLERMKDDLDEKTRSIEERDTTIADLRSELEQEKMRELPKPKAADLVSDIDPWYAGSLERFIKMLRAEANEPRVESKITAFREFFKVESQVRGIDFYDAPSSAPVVAPATPEQTTNSASGRRKSNASAGKHDLNIHVPVDAQLEDEHDYSPGGRPILKHRATLGSMDDPSSQQHSGTSAQSANILTPTSSVDDDSNKTPIQSPMEEQTQTKYKAYVPPVSTVNEATPLTHGHTIPISTVPAIASASGPRKDHDEIFFEARETGTSEPIDRSLSSDSTTADVCVPAPLSFTSNRPTSDAPPLAKDPSDALAALLPKTGAPEGPSKFTEDLRARLSVLQPTVDVDKVTRAWEKSASLTRKKSEEARRQRQEENEEHNDDLFNNNEISYAEMNQLEDEFKQKEVELKAQEDREEYKTYVASVFDPVYDGLQGDIKTLMDMYLEVEHQLPLSDTSLKSLAWEGRPKTFECLKLLKTLHQHVEQRHEKVVQAVAERDRRYKKTETQPLYAAGNIIKMKAVEKHFEQAEKQASLRTQREKAERVGEFVNLVEEVVVKVVGTEQKEVDNILAAINSLTDGQCEAELLDRAYRTLVALKSSSKSFLSFFNALEIELNNAVFDAEIAQVKAEGAQTGRAKELEAEKITNTKELMDEYERRINVLDQDDEEIQQLMHKKGWKGERA